MLTGKMIIGADFVQGTATTFRAINPVTGTELEPSFGGGGKADVDRACELAWAAFDSFRETSLEARAVFLWLNAPWLRAACRAAASKMSLAISATLILPCKSSVRALPNT
jgi:acyl-CoA reductase-like NAD-dependent aldehyde dehydrogenase